MPPNKNLLKIRGGGVDRCSTPIQNSGEVATPPPLFGAPDCQVD